MPDFGIQAGDVPGGPPLALPDFGNPPPARPSIVVTPGAPIVPKPVKTQSIKDPYAGLDDWKPSTSEAKGAPEGQPGGDPYGALDDWKPSQPVTQPREIGKGEAALGGAIEGATFGAAPAIAGIAQAGGEGTHPAAYDIYKFLENTFSSHPDPTVTANYERGRQAYLENQQQQEQQQPASFIAGQLASALAMPGGAAKGGASVAGRIGRAVLGGAGQGALYGAGTAVGEGGDLSDIASGAGSGALTGAAYGGVGAGALEGGAKIVGKARDIIRGATNPDAEAARRVLAARQADVEARGGASALSPEESAAAQSAGTPAAIVDVGGERSRALARSAANTSPEARQTLTELADNRFENQSPRIADFIRGITGGADAGADSDALQAAAVKANRPAYAKAYAAGSRPLWSPELERLSGSSALGDAAKGAARRGNDRAIASGFGAFNPKVTVKNGMVTVSKGGGVPAHPDLQFWDYVQRELADKANTAKRSGANEEANAIGKIHRDLKAELDRLVPEFKAAREGASAFFGAQDALEAGQKFVMGNANIGEARKALAKMSAPERELFARGFASELADKIERTRDRTNVLNSVFVDSPAARQKIEMALGSDHARQLEALLRAETVMDQLRRSLGNSTTARQLTELGLAGGAAGAVEYLHSGEVSPAAIISGAILFAGAKKGAHAIDEKVARRVGEMLASSDPGVLKRGIQAVSGSPALFDALRRITQAGSRVIAHDVGPSRTAGVVGASIDRIFGGEDAHPE